MIESSATPAPAAPVVSPPRENLLLWTGKVRVEHLHIRPRKAGLVLILWRLYLQGERASHCVASTQADAVKRARQQASAQQ